MAGDFFIVPAEAHDALIAAAYTARGYDAAEAAAGARVARNAAWHGIRTHNGIKALDLDAHLGSGAGGCVPRAKIEKLPAKYKAVARWNANRKLGQAVAEEAMAEAMRLADEFGIGAVTVDNAFHYLWGGGYVINAAEKGYIAYTCCTAALAEVAPFGGRTPTLGTNPHSWAFPTKEALGFCICVDWATSVIAMGRVQQFVREGLALPEGAAVDADGQPTRDAKKVAALLPFGAHKGYGLALIDELMSACTGGGPPTLRSRWGTLPPGEKGTPTFYFQAMRADALDCGDFGKGRTQAENVRAVVADVRGHGNEKVMLPGEPEARAAKLSKANGGLLFTAAEVEALGKIAREAKHPFDAAGLKKANVEG